MSNKAPLLHSDLKKAILDLKHALGTSTNNDDFNYIVGVLFCLRKKGITEFLDGIFHKLWYAEYNDESEAENYPPLEESPLYEYKHYRELMDSDNFLFETDVEVAIDSFFTSIDSQDNCAELYDAYLSEEVKECNFTAELAKLADMLIGDIKSIADPYAGMWGMVATPQREAYGIEINPIWREIGMLRAELHEMSQVKYVSGLDELSAIGCDCMVSIPPFYSYNEGRFGSQKKIYNLPDPIALFLDNEWASVRKLVCVVPSSYLSKWHSKIAELRKAATDNNFLDAIICLPNGILKSTGIYTAIIVLDKDRKADSPIRFVNAKNAFTKLRINKKQLDVDAIQQMMGSNSELVLSITKEDIINEAYSWDFTPLMIANDGKVFPEHYKVHQFREIVAPAKCRRSNRSDKAYLVTFKKEESRDWIVEHHYATDFSLTDKLTFDHKIYEEPVLLTATQEELRPVYIYASPETPIAVTSFVNAYRIIRDDIYPPYLVKQLIDEQVVLNKYEDSWSNENSILRLRIGFPSRQEQEAIYKEAVRNEMMSRAKEMNLLDVIESMKTEYINEVRMRKHDLMQYTRELGSIQRRMARILNSCDDIDELQLQLSEKLEKHAIALNCLTNLLEELSNEEAFGSPELFNIDEFFYNLEVNHDDERGYDIICDMDDVAFKEYGLPYHDASGYFRDFFNGRLTIQAALKKETDNPDIVPLLVKIAPTDFHRLVQNVIDNAEMHGFIDKESRDYELYVDVTVDPEKKMFMIDFRNNGTPFPSGLNKERYGLLGETAGTTGGTGKGGHIIKKIVEHYGGDYDVFTDGVTSTVRIWLPIANTSEDETV